MTENEEVIEESYNKPDEIFINHCVEEVYWYGYDLTFDKAYKKCVNHLEKVVRASLEYDLWAKNCKSNDPDSIRCPICQDNYYEKNSKCDTHHHPRTLYCIVDDFLSDMVNDNALKTTTASEVVRLVIKLHMQNKVSFINICTHCHSKYHAGNPDVSTKMYNIFEERIARNKETISGNISQENQPIPQSGEKQISMIPPFIPAPLPQSIDDGNYKITKFTKS